LGSNPRPPTSKKLIEKGGYRVRVRDYRILYTVDDKNKVVVIYRTKIRSEKTYK
jgi:mRNA interferase RelE/StbE